LLVGDFNAVTKTSAAYRTFMDGGFLTNLFLAAPERSGEALNTAHGYQKPRSNGIHIDWILGRGPWKAQTAEVITFEIKGQTPSDHFPVMAKVTLE
jgi:endonuclease/exonuclease/phosphatase family metal-dependent hydrolase